MARFQYHMTVFYTSNYDYTSYDRLDEVVYDFTQFVREHMARDFKMKFGATDFEAISKAVFSTIDDAIDELDFLQECMDAFHDYSFADLFADVLISRRDTTANTFHTMLELHLRQK